MAGSISLSLPPGAFAVTLTHSFTFPSFPWLWNTLRFLCQSQANAADLAKAPLEDVATTSQDRNLLHQTPPLHAPLVPVPVPIPVPCQPSPSVPEVYDVIDI
ncbi:hypothetical protein LX36DRAFT_660375 [Colletotrichum falcatum]|nr:hypothetical protein LX36DRAFT_660375 [Colletotrichum falcatum]